MAIINIDILKGKFENGDVPLGEDFTDLIDTLKTPDLIPPTQLGTNTPTTINFLRGDGVWSEGPIGPQGFQGPRGQLGFQGPQGFQGKEFRIKLSYTSKQELLNDNPTEIEVGDYAAINSTDEDNGSLYYWDGNIYVFVFKFAGVQGLAGKDFRIKLSYTSKQELLNDNPTEIIKGEFAIINSNDSDNGNLYLWDGTQYLFVSCLGGLPGKDGIIGIDGIPGKDFIIRIIYNSLQELENDLTPSEIVASEYAIINSNDEHNGKLYIWDGLEYIFITNISGPKGFQGPQGAQGFQGNDGIDGVQGNDGIDGVQGPKGIPGPETFSLSGSILGFIMSNDIIHLYIAPHTIYFEPHFNGALAKAKNSSTNDYKITIELDNIKIGEITFFSTNENGVFSCLNVNPIVISQGQVLTFIADTFVDTTLSDIAWVLIGSL